MIDQFETLEKFVTRSLNRSPNNPTCSIYSMSKIYEKMRDGQGIEREWKLKGEHCGSGSGMEGRQDNSCQVATRAMV